MMNLKFLRKDMKDICSEYNMKFGDLFILLYANHEEVFTTNKVIKEVPFGCETVSRGMRRLKAMNFISLIKGGGGKNKTKALYSISGKGKTIVQHLYLRLKRSEHLTHYL